MKTERRDRNSLSGAWPAITLILVLGKGYGCRDAWLVKKDTYDSKDSNMGISQAGCNKRRVFTVSIRRPARLFNPCRALQRDHILTKRTTRAISFLHKEKQVTMMNTGDEH